MSSSPPPVYSRLALKKVAPVEHEPLAGPPSPKFGRTRLVTRDLATFRVASATASDASFHSYDRKEVARFIARINEVMHGVVDFEPIAAEEAELFKRVADGHFLCRLLHACEPGSVHESVLAKAASGAAAKVSGQRHFVNSETVASFLIAAKKIGLELGHIGSSDFAHAHEDHKEHLILGVIWQLLRRSMANELRTILERAKQKQAAAGGNEGGEGGEGGEGETQEQQSADIAKAVRDPEVFLVEWASSALVAGGSTALRAGATVADFSTSHSDVLARLVHALDPTEASAAAVAAEDPRARAEAVLSWAREHAVPSIAQAEDLTDSNPRLILPFLMATFTWSSMHSHEHLHSAVTATAASAAAAAAAAAAATLTGPIYVVRQHYMSPGDPATSVPQSSSSSSICAFRSELDALKYVLTENLVLVGTDPELPHVLEMAAAYARAAGFDEASAIESLGPIPSVIASPEGEPDDAVKLRGRVESFVAQVGSLAQPFVENLSAVLLSHSLVKLYSVDTVSVF